MGAERAQRIGPHLRAALAGTPSTFETSDATASDVRQFQVSYVPDAPDGHVQGVIAVVSDLTEAHRAESERGRVLDLEQRRRHEAEAIADLGRLLTQRLELDAVAHRIAELSRILLGGIAATAYRLDESGALRGARRLGRHGRAEGRRRRAAPAPAWPVWRSRGGCR